jgi:hypothetical protein
MDRKTVIEVVGAPAVWLSQRAGFELHHLWVLSVVTVALQAVVAWWMLGRQMRRVLAPAGAAGVG